ncbi:MAG: hypothetical protein A2Z96_01170 [Spirochaetes bacterium GWB1_48_6]|nr:MAG: hypothetical protein A2Z96_01170 [Spirochaetes bacterium GWB1_48_6]
MDSSIRASALAGLGAFALSVIVALFSRVPFGTLFLRALLSGLGFACLSYGSLWLLKRFLPDLFDETARPPQELGSDGTMGSVVDIVLPGGEEDRLETATQADGTSKSFDSASFMSGISAQSVESGELAREVANLRADALISNDPADSSSQGTTAPRPSVALDELDTLPDLDGFSESFSDGQPGGSDLSDSSGGSPAGDASRYMGVSDSMPTAGSPDRGKDPVVLAKAVQTLLRRDQKGQ